MSQDIVLVWIALRLDLVKSTPWRAQKHRKYVTYSGA